MREMLLYKELKGDEKKEFENKHSDKAFRCEQEKKNCGFIEGAYLPYVTDDKT